MIDDLRELRQETNEGCNDTPLLFDVQPWMLNRDERSAVAPLPHTWDVTSDSIAAALAIELEADELVLLKSTPTPSTDVDELSALGYVDRYFLKLAERVRKVRFVGLKC